MAGRASGSAAHRGGKLPPVPEGGIWSPWGNLGLPRTGSLPPSCSFWARSVPEPSARCTCCDSAPPAFGAVSPPLRLLHGRAVLPACAISRLAPSWHAVTCPVLTGMSLQPCVRFYA